jgi:regulator of sirC expression with transglutaminase-like and TPR domain
VISEKELKALVRLLDDTDVEVLDHVTQKIRSLGHHSIPVLEHAWESASNALIQERLESIIQQIYFDNTKDRFKYWLQSEERGLLEAAILIARIHYPELDENQIFQKIDKIKQAIWLEFHSGLTTLEEVNVVNQIFYVLHGFIGEQNPKPDPDLGFINKVLDTHKGNSISLGIIYLILAQKMDILVYGVNLPYHFILCATHRILTDKDLDNYAQEQSVLFYINPLNKGLVFSRSEITHYLEQSKIKSSEKYYAPCSNTDIVKTLIFNQIFCFKKQNDDIKVEMFQELLALIQE